MLKSNCLSFPNVHSLSRQVGFLYTGTLIGDSKKDCMKNASIKFTFKPDINKLKSKLVRNNMSKKPDI